MGFRYLCSRLVARIGRKSSSPFLKSHYIGQRPMFAASFQTSPRIAQIFRSSVEFSTGATPPFDTPPKHSKNLVRNVIPDDPVYEKWIIVMEFPENVSDSDKLGAFVRMAAKVLKCSEEEAKAKIYKTQTKTYYGFHIETSKEMAKMFAEESEVGQVIPDFFCS